MSSAKPREETRRTPSGEEGVEEWELGVPPAPAIPLEDRPEFRAAVVQLKQALRPGERPFDEASRVVSDLPPAPPSELRVHAAAVAVPQGKGALTEGAKVAVAPGVDPRRAVTERLHREAKPGVPLSPLPPAMPTSVPVPSGRGGKRRWSTVGVLLLLAMLGVLVTVSQLVPHEKGAAVVPPVATSSGGLGAWSATMSSTALPASPPLIEDRPPASSLPSAAPPAVPSLRPELVQGKPKGAAPNEDPYDAAPPNPAKTAAPLVPPAPVPVPVPATAVPAAPKPSSTAPAAPADGEIFHRPKPRVDDAATP